MNRLIKIISIGTLILSLATPVSSLSSDYGMSRRKCHLKHKSNDNNDDKQSESLITYGGQKYDAASVAGQGSIVASMTTNPQETGSNRNNNKNGTTNTPSNKKVGGWMSQIDLNANGAGYKDAIDSLIGQTRIINLQYKLNHAANNRAELIENLKSMFQYAQSKNVLVLPRFYYVGGEPSFEQVIKKDVQLIVNTIMNFKDSIYVIQAGFLGVDWGEWWGTTLTPEEDDGKNAQVREAKTFVVNSLLRVGVPVALRYPGDIAIYYHGNDRVTLHNDCILADGPGQDDEGTFDRSGPFWADGDIRGSQEYAQNKIKGPKGGENCDAGSHVATCEELLKYVKDFKLTYLNNNYPANVKSIFDSKSTCMQQITQALQDNGSRL